MQAPDITLFQAESNQVASSSNNVMLVPNMRVLDRSTTDWDENSYVRAFSDAGHQVLKTGKGVRILIHETFGKDAELAEKIRIALNLEKTCIFTSEDPSVLKTEISNSCFLFGSRFHSLAGALSTATPVVSIGWAHKYAQLLADFGVEQFDIKSQSDAERIPSLIAHLLQDGNRSKVVADLIARKKALAAQNDAMWNEVIKTLQDVESRGGREG